MPPAPARSGPTGAMPVPWPRPALLGAYRPAHRPSDRQRHVRGPLMVRDALVRTRTRYISVVRALLRQHGYRVPSGSAELSLRPQRGCGVRGWGRDGLGTGARGRGARPRRALMLPSLPGPAARTLDPGDLPLQGPARRQQATDSVEGLGERGRRSGPARPRPRLMPLVTALSGSRTPFPLPRSRDLPLPGQNSAPAHRSPPTVRPHPTPTAHA